MTDKKFTDEEIIKALECHIKAEDCEGCEMFGGCEEIILTERVLDLINRQKAEIKKLNVELIHALSELSLTRTSLNTAKAEAYKELAQEIKQEIKEAYDSNIEVLNEHFEKHRGCFNDTFVGIIEGKNNALLGLSDFIDNLLKELGCHIEE